MLIAIKCQEIIELSLSDAYNKFYIKLYLGNPLKFIYFQVDLASQVNFGTNERVYKDSKTIEYIKKEKIIIKGREIETDLVKDQIRLFPANTKPLDNFKLYVGDKNRPSVVEIISMTYHYQDISNSFLELLFSNNFISHKIFGFCLGKKYKDEGAFYLGGVPEKFRSHNSTKCKVNKDHFQWGCNISYLIIDSKKVYPSKKYLYFQTLFETIYVPKNEYHYIYENIFKKYYLKNDTCVVLKKIYCKCSHLYYFPQIQIVIDDISIKLSYDDLFLSISNVCSFEVVENDKEEWILGLNAIRKYSMFFDKEQDAIMFFSNESMIPEISKINSSNKVFLYLLSFILLASTLWLIIIKLYKEKFFRNVS